MENKPSAKSFLPILLVFIITTGLFVSGEKMLARFNINQPVVLIGNIILFIATAVSFYFYFQSLRNNRVQVFLRMIYGGMFIKMFICLIAAFIYIMATGKQVNKGGIFMCMFLYFVYSVIEISTLLKISKRNSNAKA